MLSRFVVFASLLVVFVAASPLVSRAPETLMSIFHLEEPCVRQGGICLPISECDPDNLVQLRGVYCPEQRHLQVECCYHN